MIREHKPKVIVEFGTRGGRCTHDILKGLFDNKIDFIYKPYEIDSYWRLKATTNLKNAFGDKAPIIGNNIVETNDIPDNIDYLFVDNSHDYETTKWVFEYLLPKKCINGALVHFHDLVIHGEFEFTMPSSNNIPPDGEQKYFYDLNKLGKFPLEKIYWTWEEGFPWSSTWWIYKK
jgi:predicted O-methyltransferase YrrM